MLTFLLIVLALVLLLATAWLYRRGVIVKAAGLLWLGFVLYEVWFRANCRGDCNIRVDLVVLMPVLLVVTLAAIASVVHGVLRKRSSDVGRREDV